MGGTERSGERGPGYAPRALAWRLLHQRQRLNVVNAGVVARGGRRLARATCSASRIHDCANVSQKALFLLLSEACAIVTHCSANFR